MAIRTDRGERAGSGPEGAGCGNACSTEGILGRGGEVLFGTDVGYMTDADPADEYELMAKAGPTPMQVLASLTSPPASRWKDSDRRGRVAPGMDADLVVLDADPTVDARNFAKVRCTFAAER